MALPNETRVSPEAYLEYDLASEIKNEYAYGQIYAMSGASPEHIDIASAIHISLGTQLQGRSCRVRQTDMRVHIEATGSYRYPDITVVCGTPEYVETNPQSLVNPVLIAEVLSPSTMKLDRTDKLDEYKQIASLQEILLVWQDTPRIVHYQRSTQHNWTATDFVGMENLVEITSLDCRLPFEDVYQWISFETGA